MVACVSLEGRYVLFDQPVACALEDGYVLRVYGRDFIQAFIRGTHAELELWARPLRTSLTLDLMMLVHRLSNDNESLEFYLDDIPVHLSDPARCWVSVWI
jgi:hypothetical protein